MAVCSVVSPTMPISSPALFTRIEARNSPASAGSAEASTLADSTGNRAAFTKRASTSGPLSNSWLPTAIASVPSTCITASSTSPCQAV